MLAIADALAVTVMAARDVGPEVFAARHHGGYLGRVAERMVVSSVEQGS
jgi:hypothetical protein